MKNFAKMVLGLGCFWFLFVGVVVAEESTPAQQAPVLAIAEKSSQAAVLEAQIKAKRNEVKAVEEKIEALRNRQNADKEAERIRNKSEKQSRLEALKQNDPVQYHREMAQQFARQKNYEQLRKQKVEEFGVKPKMTHAQWLDTIKKNNPLMYDLALKKDALQSEIKVLQNQMHNLSKK